MSASQKRWPFLRQGRQGKRDMGYRARVTARSALFLLQMLHSENNSARLRCSRGPSLDGPTQTRRT